MDHCIYICIICIVQIISIVTNLLFMSHIVFSKDSCKNIFHPTGYSTMCPGYSSHPEMRSITPFESSGFGMTSAIEYGKNLTVWLPRLGHKWWFSFCLLCWHTHAKIPELLLKKGCVPGHCAMGTSSQGERQQADVLLSSPSLLSFTRLISEWVFRWLQLLVSESL